MRKFEELFNRSLLSRFLNSSTGRIFRLAAGAGFLIVGYAYRPHAPPEQITTAHSKLKGPS